MRTWYAVIVEQKALRLAPELFDPVDVVAVRGNHIMVADAILEEFQDSKNIVGLITIDINQTVLLHAGADN